MIDTSNIFLTVFQGSTSPHKTRSVLWALSKLRLTLDTFNKFAVDSGVPRQPEGLTQAHTGATNRAHRAWEKGWREVGEGRIRVPVDGHTITIGAENVIVPVRDLPVDHPEQRHVESGLCIIKSRLEEDIVTIIPGQMLDPRDVAEARRRGFDRCIVTDVTRERTGQCEPDDSTPYHTDNRVSRVDCLEIAVRIAMSQYLMKIRSTNT